ncbi:uncharacterized protein K441DRAFT_86336 [Cenococcum geophilum 1.58]|uniref:uncharacterized protein n=1 Tax=Cenococcum geophilum 1.58 TaxID=794803 RepID=UPI00358FD991|nr:hypothetical protein K441DRAFT_86336 [Cenococcum geophilum 1.58]
MFTFSFLQTSVLIFLIDFALCIVVPKYPTVNSTAPLASSTNSVAAPANISACTYVVLTTQLFWVAQTSTTTITAATHVIIIDPRTNKTSTTILRDPNASLSTQAVETNAQGTQITTLTFSDTTAQTAYTTVIAFPAVFVDYDDSFFLVGSLAETANASSTKASPNFIARVETPFPSHPIYPPPATATDNPQINSDTDRRGLNFLPALITSEDKNSDFYRTAFPNEPAVQSCLCGGFNPFIFNGQPEVFVNQIPVASFITATSTSYATIADPTSARLSNQGISTATPAAPVIQASAPATIGTLSAPAATGTSKSIMDAPLLESSVADFLSTTTSSPATPTSTAVDIFHGDGPAQLVHGESSVSGLGDAATSIIQTPRISSKAEPSVTVLRPAPSSTDLIGPELSSVLAGFPPAFTERIESSATGLPDEEQQTSQPAAITTEGPDGITVVIAQPASSPAAPPQTLTIAGQTITQNSASAFVISSQTLALGAPAITLGQGSSTTVVSLATNSAGATVVFVGTDSSTIQPQATPAHPTLTIAGQTLTPTTATDLLIGGQTLAPGGPPITLGTGVSTTVLSLAHQQRRRHDPPRQRHPLHHPPRHRPRPSPHHRQPSRNPPPHPAIPPQLHPPHPRRDAHPRRRLQHHSSQRHD